MCGIGYLCPSYSDLFLHLIAIFGLLLYLYPPPPRLLDNAGDNWQSVLHLLGDYSDDFCADDNDGVFLRAQTCPEL